jgi:WD40 repeat protein
MRIKLSKHMSIGIVGLTILWVLAACAPASPPSQTTNPSDTPVPISSPTGKPTPSPPPSETPIPTVPCFETYYDPFAFLPDGLTLLVRAEMGVQLFNLETMQTVKFIQAPSIINGPAVDLSPAGILAWGFEDGTIQQIRLPDLQLISTAGSGHTGPVKLEYSPTNEKLYSGSQDGWINYWNLNGSQADSMRPVDELMNFSISPDGSMIAVIPSEGSVYLYGLDNYSRVKEFGSSGGSDTSDVAFSPDGQYLAADLATGLHVWRIADGKELLGGDAPIYSMAVAYSPDGKYLAYADINTVVLSSPDGSKMIRSLPGHQAPIFELLFSPDSSILVSADNLEIRVWQVEDGELLAVGKRECK